MEYIQYIQVHTIKTRQKKHPFVSKLLASLVTVLDWKGDKSRFEACLLVDRKMGSSGAEQMNLLNK